jgi:protein tyrosine/serine phosphatase
VEARYLETAFAAIEARHGTVDAYLEQVLGVTSERREAIAARLLA